MNYYRRYVGDYQRKTMRLDPTDHGVYDLMLDYYYSEEEPLPLEMDDIYAICKASKPEHRKSVAKVLRLYFHQQADGYHNIRADEELGIAQTVIETARENGKLGGRPKKKPVNNPEDNQKGNQDETQTITSTEPAHNHPPTTNHHPPTTSLQPPTPNRQEKTQARKRAAIRPQHVAEKVWNDFAAIRTAKRAPLTETALEGIEREAKKAGFTLQAALETACRRGWQGFEAKWLNGSHGNADAAAEAKRRIFGEEKDVTDESTRL